MAPNGATSLSDSRKSCRQEVKCAENAARRLRDRLVIGQGTTVRPNRTTREGQGAPFAPPPAAHRTIPRTSVPLSPPSAVRGMWGGRALSRLGAPCFRPRRPG
eukprot:7389125-Prymnesium_polylepis.1